MLHFAHQYLQLLPGGFELCRALSNAIFKSCFEDLKLAAVREQIQECFDLCPKNGGRNRYAHIINRTTLIPLQLVQFGMSNRRNENDGSLRKTRMAANLFWRTRTRSWSA